MKVKCSLCDKIEEIDSESLLAKRFMNHPLKTYLCTECNSRITMNTRKHQEHQYKEEKES